ncbi:hypothetical protein [Burkholderia sp. RS02]|uniref:hypothetical protein n=1 Tax=unclassified Burkholderia TaxID=2613784 RepID=UPI0032184E7A
MSTTSPVASIDFTNLTDNCSRYLVEICDLTTDTDGAELWLRFAENGNWINSAIYAYAWFFANSEPRSGIERGSASYMQILNGMRVGEGLGTAGRIDVYDPHGSSAYRRLTWDMQGANALATARYIGAGSYTSLNPINGIRLQLSSGNIKAATVKLYEVN